MKDRELMQQALEAFEWNYNTDLDNIPACEQWAKMLKENITALRAALAEPETVMHQYKYQAYGYYKEDGKLKLGTMPEPQTTHWEGCEAVHPECRKPEPVVQLEFAGTLPISRGGYAPTPRKPLMDEEIEALWQSTSPYYDHQDFARAIERKHGIGEQI